MKMKRTWIRLACLLLLIVTAVGITAVHAANKDLVLEDMSIVYPADASQPEQTAAYELQSYLAKITGTKPVVRAESDTDNFMSSQGVIFVGNTKTAAQVGITYTDNNGLGEGWAIKVVGNNVFVNGGKNRGVLYSVYHLLEDVLGVRWWNLWEEYVPTMADATMPADYEDSGEPLFAYRDVYFGAQTTANKYLAFLRNRLNGEASNGNAAHGGEETFTKPYSTHTFALYFPPTRYFAAHPEWYAWSNTRQERISHGQLCLSNEELIAAFTEKMLTYIKESYATADRNGQPRPRFADATPNDAGGFCECDLCLATIAKKGESGYLIDFTNKLAEAVEKQYPEVIVETSAYSSYLQLPLDDTKPRSNVMIRLCDSRMDLLQDMDHPNNADALTRIREWGELCKDSYFMLWDYGVIYSKNGIFPNLFRFDELLQTFYENGGTAYFVELEEVNNAEFWDMKAWMLAKLLEDPYQDEEALMMDFLTGYYGEAAADHLYSYLTFTHSRAVTAPQRLGWSVNILDPDWMSAEDILKAHNYFESAVRATEEDPSLTATQRKLFLDRINAARVGLDRVILENHTEYIVEMGTKGKAFPVDERAVGERVVTGLEFLMNMSNKTTDYSGWQSIKKRVEMDTGVRAELPEYDKYRTETHADDIPDAVLADHPNVDSIHVYDFTPGKTWLANTKETFLTVQNGVLRMDYAGAVAYYGQTDKLNDFMISDTRPLATSFDSSLLLGDPVVADGQYHLYRLENVAPVPSNYKAKLFGESVVVDMTLLGHSANRKMDVYLSMKVDGDPASGNYVISIDRLLVVEPCLGYGLSYPVDTPATCTANATQKGTCPVCGKVGITEIEDSKIPHTIEYTYDTASSAYLGQCAVCGQTNTYAFATELPAEVQSQLPNSANSFDHVWDFGTNASNFTMNVTGTRVNDDLSAYGSAVTNTGLLTPSKPLDIRTYGTGGTVLGELTYDRVKPNSGKGYYAYLVADDVTIGAFNGISLWNNSFIDYSPFWDSNRGAQLKGKIVDVYISMRTVAAAGGEKFYIDRYILVESCENFITFSEGMDPFCTTNATRAGTCTKCKAVYYSEVEGTALGHLYEEYILNADGKYEATCVRCGETILAGGRKAQLPAELLAELPHADRVDNHIWDYDTASFLVSGNAAVVADEQSVFGSAVAGTPLVPGTDVHVDVEGTDGQTVTVGQLSFSTIMEKYGGGYFAYKVADDVIPVRGDSCSIRILDTEALISDRTKAALANKQVDIYLSVRSEGVAEGLQLYIDRLLLVEDCFNYISEADFGPVCQPGSSHCPICGAVYSRQTAAVPHSFTEYLPAQWGDGQYAAQCDYGCGTTDEKQDTKENPLALLPAELPEHARRHIIQVYRAGDFTQAVSSRSVFDPVLDRPVIERDYDRTTDSDFYVALDMDANGVYIGVVGDNKGSYNIGYFNGRQVIQNAGKGYVLYRATGLDPYKNDTSIDYLYLFSDWALQLWHAQDDLKNYRGKPVDLYLYMRVEGDPTCATEDKPTYYLDQLIITESCDLGDQCTHGITQEAIVRFDPNGGMGAMAPVAVSRNGAYILPECAFTAPTQMAFAGWKVGNQIVAAGEAVTVTEDLILRPVWIRNVFTVRFESGGGSLVAPQTVTGGNPAEQPADPVREGYSFAGWYTDEALTNAYDFTSAVHTDVTLYAKWEEYEPETPSIADRLHHLGLFLGTGNGYELDSELTRAQGITLLVRILGKEQEATSNTYEMPFTDVPDWAKGYVGYAFTNGITNGVSETKFDPDGVMTDYMFLTLILRALGYRDVVWNDPYALAQELYLVADTAPDDRFTRGDAVDVLWNALYAKGKDGKTLSQQLIYQGVFTKAQLEDTLRTQ